MCLLSKPSVSIKDLRRIPNTSWKAAQTNFGTWAYNGTFKGKQLELISYAYSASMFDGDDDTFDIRWVLYVDRIPLHTISASVAETVKSLLQKL